MKNDYAPPIWQDRSCRSHCAAQALRCPSLRLASRRLRAGNFPRDFCGAAPRLRTRLKAARRTVGAGRRFGTCFSHTPGKTHQRRHGRCGRRFLSPVQGRRAAADSNLGVSAYRMSISWPRDLSRRARASRIQTGLDYYKRVVDELLANHITPYVTLFHWDLPAALPGGWQSRDTAQAFADYAGYVARAARPIACTTS